MTDSNEKLKQMLRDERVKPVTDTVSEGDQARNLGSMLNATLVSRNLSRADFARQLDMDLLLVSGIIDGLLPASELDDFTLVDMARALQLEPNVLRTLVGRALPSQSDVSGKNR